MLLAAATLAGCSGGDLDEPEMTVSSSASTASGSSGSSAKAAATTTAQAASKNSEPECTDAALRRSPGISPELTISECYGDNARIGFPNSDWVEFVHWNGSVWELIPKDGTSPKAVMDGRCYRAAVIDPLNLDPALRSKITTCEELDGASSGSTKSQSSGGSGNNSGLITKVSLGEAVTHASYPACDGRNILILQSVIDSHPEKLDTSLEIAFAVMTGDPSNKEYTVPGQCSSLRAKVDGYDIYPVYVDYGSNQAAMCAAKAKYGGNGRTLNNSGDFGDPC